MAVKMERWRVLKMAASKVLLKVVKRVVHLGLQMAA